MTHPAEKPDDDADTKPNQIYPIAGAIALGLAIAIQLAPGGLSHESLANLSPIVAKPYQFAGKLCLTLPLAAFGLALLCRNTVVNRRSLALAPVNPARPTGVQRTTTHLLTPVSADDETLAEAEEMEEEPLAEEVPASNAPKIAAKPGRFDGRLSGPPKPTAKSTKDRGMELETQKYVDKSRRLRSRSRDEK